MRLISFVLIMLVGCSAFAAEEYVETSGNTLRVFGTSTEGDRQRTLERLKKPQPVSNGTFQSHLPPSDDEVFRSVVESDLTRIKAELDK